jgi:hypothetical protein
VLHSATKTAGTSLPKRSCRRSVKS